MQKPTKKVMEYYDYHECRDYLQAKYGYDERDYAGRYQQEADDSIPYQDFWHFVLHMTGETAYNNHYFTMSDHWLKDARDWQKEILERYLSEFGELNEHGERTIGFYAWH